MKIDGRKVLKTAGLGISTVLITLGLISCGESESSNSLENRSKNDSAVVKEKAEPQNLSKASDQEVSDVVVVVLGENTYKMQRTNCRNDPDNYFVSADTDGQKSAAQFRLRRTKFAGDAYLSQLNLEAGDQWVGLDPAPWNYRNGTYVYNGDVDVYGVGGSGTKKVKRMMVKAPC